MRVTVHIGTYKTATSSIQYALRRSTDQLARVGARYADSGLNEGLSKHLALYDHIIDMPANQHRRDEHAEHDYLADLRQELGTPGLRHLIVSEEELSYPDPAVAQFFAQLQDVATVDVVMVVREQARFLESLYLQFLKEPPRQVFGTFDEWLGKSDAMARGDFHGLLRPWVDHLGRDHVKVVDFDELRRGNAITAFARLVGIPTDLDMPLQRINPSVSPAGGEAIRRLAAVESSWPRMATARLLREHEGDDRTTLLTDDRVERIRAKFADSNRRLAEQFGVDLHPTRSSSAVPLDATELGDRAADLMAQVTVHMWRRGNVVTRKARRLQEAVDLVPDILDASYLLRD